MIELKNTNIEKYNKIINFEEKSIKVISVLFHSFIQILFLSLLYEKE